MVRNLSLELLRQEGERFMEEVSREAYLAHSGLKPSADLQSIYQRHDRIFSSEAMELVLDFYRSAQPGTEQMRLGRSLLDWQIDSGAQRVLAELDEREIAWESSALVRLEDGSSIPYERAGIEIGNAQDREHRLAIERGRASLVARELAPLRLERFQKERDFVESVGIAPDYLAVFAVVSGVDLQALATECAAFLRDTRPMWDDIYAEAVRTRLHIKPSEATRADAKALLRAPEFDRFFPSNTMEDAVRRQVREMGIDPEAAGRIRFDTSEREGKRSRAFCSPVQVPAEVYLVLRPHGGQTDYSTFLHELGHALHFAYVRPDYPFEYRWLGDNSVTESYAMLLDHLLYNPRWLLKYTGLGRNDVASFLRSAGLEELQFLRRYCAKLIYEIELYSGALSWAALPDRYVDLLTDSTSFRYDGSDAFVDVDPRFYSARYLRAWQLQSLLSDVLVKLFDSDWYRNPRAGPWIVENLFSEGQRELAHELAARVSGRELSFSPLVRATEAMLVGV